MSKKNAVGVILKETKDNLEAAHALIHAAEVLCNVTWGHWDLYNTVGKALEKLNALADELMKEGGSGA